MADPEEFVEYLRKPDIRPQKMPIRYCPGCSTLLDTFCHECGAFYVYHETLYECGACGSLKKQRCSECNTPLPLDCFYFGKHCQ